MTQDQDSGDKFSMLRSRAEETIGGKPSDMDDISTMSPEDFQRLVHELRVHQIELEMQNEELRQSQIKLEELKDRYLDLYDFAPVGYITLNDRGLILEANLTAARLLGVERQVLINIPFSRFVSQEFGDAYYLHLRKVFETQSKQTCEIKLVREDGTQFHAQLESNAVQEENGEFSRCRTIVTDISGHKKAEKALTESYVRLKKVLEVQTVGVMFWDLTSGCLVDANDTFLRMMGYTRSDVENRLLTWQKLTPPEYVEASQAEIKKFYEIGRVGPYEKEYLLKDGTLQWFVFAGSSLGENSCVEFCVDISKRKEAEAALQRSEERLRYVLEGSDEGFWDWNLETGEVQRNERWAEMLGYSFKDIALTVPQWDEMVHPEDKDRAWKSIEDHLEGKTLGHECEYRMLTKDGSWKWILDRARVVKRDERGKPLRMAGTHTDISHRKKFEEALRESEHRYRAVVDNLHVGISVINREMEIVAINPFLKAYYPDVRPGSGQTCYSTYNENPKSLPCSYCPCLLTFQDGEVHESETETPLGDKIRNYRLVSCPVKDEHGEVQLVVELVEDVTERRSLYAQLAQAQKMEAVGTLAGGVAHDFNNVLQVALGYSEILLGDTEVPQRCRADLQKINESAQRGADLVQRLLTFSRKTEINLHPLDLNDRITDLRKMLERTLPKMVDIQLVLDVKLANINADKTQIDQVLMNLAVNARDAMPEGGKLVFETANVLIDEEYSRTHFEAHPGPHVLLMVTDTGSGMDKDILEHIFEPFYTTKGVGEGTGLGLAMVHGIVKNHGGTISCYSELGHGTTFKIYFPALASDEKAEETTERPMLRGGSETILLVDDEEFVRDIGSRNLLKYGYKVISASNGKEALEVYEKSSHEIDLVLLDLMMPEMGGKQCLEGLLSLNPSVKVVIASGFSANGPTMDALSAGAKAFVNKPYDTRQVLGVVREVLDSE